MVLTWNQEPSKDLARSNLSPPKPRAPSAVFFSTPRFVRDGTSRVQNFLNGHDTQHLEIPPARRAHVDTSTHTTWAERLTGADGGVTTLVDALNKSLFSAAALRSNRPKSATPQSHVANDTRYAHIHDPYDNSLGPGSFSLDLAKPPVGTLPPETPGAGAVPARDPFRRSAAFMSPDRPSSASWVRAFGPDIIHSSPDFKPSQDFSVAFHRQTGRSTDDVRDWRYNLRLHDDKRDASPEAEVYESAERDLAGRPARVAVAASARNTAAASFMSKEARFARLPNSRTNDNRIGRMRHDEMTYTNLGPGAYLPLTSIGGAKRSTYRMYQMPTDQQQQHRRPIRRSSSAQPFAQQRSGSPLNTARSGQSGTVPFTSTFRGQKYGPHEWSRDSTLLRTR